MDQIKLSGRQASKQVWQQSTKDAQQQPSPAVDVTNLQLTEPACVITDSWAEGRAAHKCGAVKHQRPHPWGAAGASQRGGGPV